METGYFVPFPKFTYFQFSILFHLNDTLVILHLYGTATVQSSESSCSKVYLRL